VVPGESFTALLRAQGLEPRWSLPADASLVDAPEGTTVLAFRYADGVLMAGDRRATAGNVIAYRTMQKVFPADAYSAVGISGTAGVGVELIRLFQTEGRQLKAALINTTSGSGLLGNIGQANYAAAKAGITAFTIVAAMELAQYGVRCNVLAPYARTRLTLQTPGMDALVKAPDDPAAFDVWDPANVAPVVAYLATEDCPISGAVLHVGGGEVGLFRGWDLVDVIHTDGRFTIGELAKKASKLLEGRPRFPSVALTMEEMGAGFVARHTAGA